MAQEPIYLQSYGLSEAPFRLSPDPGFFYPSRSHLAAKEVLKYAIANDEGFMVLLGQAGTGKTLTLRMLMAEIPDNKVTALIVSPAVSPQGLLRLLLDELAISATDSQELAVMVKDFQDYLIGLASSGSEVLIIIDEAQNMPIDTLEQLRMLSNIETDNKKLLQVMLVGQPELADLLSDSRLGQLTQRIVVQEKLATFDPDEMMEYVKFRMAKAGRGDLGLSKRAQKELFKLSHGIPRLINRLMDRSLLIAGSKQSRIIELSHIQIAQQSLPLPANIAKERPLPSYAIAITALVATLMVMLYWLRF